MYHIAKIESYFSFLLVGRQLGRLWNQKQRNLTVKRLVCLAQRRVGVSPSIHTCTDLEGIADLASIFSTNAPSAEVREPVNISSPWLRR